MDIREALGSLHRQVEGAVLSVLVGSDGESIDLYCSESSLDAEWIGARFGIVVRDILGTLDRLNQGELRTIVLELEKGILIILPLRGLFSLMVFLEPQGNLGQALFHGRVVASALEKELVS
jgi:predicted regulator of Ras-like GTPase activity (Roadblock/LC7/MglB family)